MPNPLKFEIRPIDGKVAAVGEAVIFREANGKLYAINEDGEAFGTVPSKFAAILMQGSLDGVTAEVCSRENGIPVIEVAIEAPSMELADDETDAAQPESAADIDQNTAEDGVEASAEQADATPEESLEETQPITAAPKEAKAAKTPAAEAEKPKSKKKLPLIIAAVVIILFLFVMLIGGEGTQSVTVGHVTLEVPDTWTVEDLGTGEDDVWEYYYGIYADDFDGGILIEADMPSSPYFTDYSLPSLLSGMGIEGDPVEEYTTDEGAIVYRYEQEIESSSGKATSGYLQVVISGDYGAIVYAYCASDDFEDNADELEEILDGMEIVDPAEPTFLQTQTIGSGEVTVEVPASWSVEVASASTETYADGYQGKVVVTNGNEITNLQDTYSVMLWLVVYGYGVSGDDVASVEDNGAIIWELSVSSYDVDYADEEEVESNGFIYIVYTGDTYYIVQAFCAVEDYDLYASELEAIMATLTIEDPAEPYGTEDEDEEEEAEATEEEAEATSTASASEIVSALNNLGTFEETTLSGSGDDVVDLPVSSVPMILEISYSGSSNFVVKLLDSSGDSLDLIVNEIGSYSGTHTTYLDYSGSAMLQISSSGSWTITCKPMGTMGELVNGQSYTGSNVLYIDAETLTKLTITNSGDSNFVVRGIGMESSKLLVNEIGDYSGTVVWSESQSFLIVESDGTWSVSW